MIDEVGDNLSHPDSLIRLTSTVLRFRCPSISSKSAKDVNYLQAFRTVGTHATTQKVLKTANSTRDYLIKALSAKKKSVPHKTIAAASEQYITPIHQLLIACRVQPESARLDQRLIFEWCPGIEDKPRYFKSEAIMYELCMAIATYGIATAGVGTDECTAGDFAAASRNFKKASGVFEFLGNTQLPSWQAKSSKALQEALPAECRIGVCQAFQVLFLGIAQQMAVATVLMKEGTPNWSLLSKLSLGISEMFEEFVTLMRNRAPDVKTLIDPEFFVLMTTQIELQKSFSLYFHARHYWENELDYGLGIAMMNKALSGMRFRETPTGAGLPPISKKSPLKSIEKDMNYVKAHVQKVLSSWEKDNSSIYFVKVPLTVPADKKLAQGVRMMKPELYELPDVEPVALILPEGDDIPQHTEDSDYELAKALQEQLNAE